MTDKHSATERFGAVLAAKRRERGLTQDQLIARAGNVCTKAFISQLENDRYRKQTGEPMQPDIAIVEALADALGEPRNYFRRLTGYPLIEDELPQDPVSEEFGYVVSRYRELSERGRGFAKKHITSTIDFILELERGDDPVADEAYREPPPITLEEAQEIARLKGAKDKK